MRFLPPLPQRAQRAYRTLPLLAVLHRLIVFVRVHARVRLRRASCCSSHRITSYLLLPPTILQLPPNMFFAIPLRVFMHMPRCQDGDCDAA